MHDFKGEIRRGGLKPPLCFGLTLELYRLASTTAYFFTSFDADDVVRFHPMRGDTMARHDASACFALSIRLLIAAAEMAYHCVATVPILLPFDMAMLLVLCHPLLTCTLTPL